MVPRLARMLVFSRTKGFNVGERGQESLELIKTNLPPDNEANVSQVYVPKTRVFLLGVGRRAKLEMDTANHVGLPLMPPSPPPLSLLSIQSADINTDLHSFAGCGLHHRPGGEKAQEERGKDRADQMVSVLGLLLPSPLKEDKKKRQKLLLRGGRGEEEKGRRTNRSESRSSRGQWVSMAPEGETGGGGFIMSKSC